MEIKDLGGLSEPLKKLIEVVAQGVGRVSASHFIRKDAEARAYAMRQLADAKGYEIRQLADATDYARQKLGTAEFQNEELSLPSPPESLSSETKLLAERASSRRKYEDQVEQLNIEEITSHAFEELKQEEMVSSEPVDPDWIKRFFDIARNISDDEMQMIWGKILAGEILRPETYSLRTLELLRNLSRAEAEIFVKVARCAIRFGNTAFVFYPDRGELLADTFGVRFGELLRLAELGLMFSDELSITVSDESRKVVGTFIYGDHIVQMENSSLKKKTMPVRAFTSIGSQLLNLVETPVNMDYLHRFAERLAGPDSTVRLGKIIERQGDKIGFTPIEIFGDVDDK